jgi:pyridoxal phosphate enzyme (YggS family)
VNEVALQDTIASNLAAVRSRIERAAARAGRDPAGIRLVAVSKTFPAAHVEAARATGQLDFGENRIQEALEKIAALHDPGIRWHLIGHLQSNKTRKAVGPFALIQSLDSLDLLRRLDAIAREEHRTVDALIQVDLAGESTKFGLPADGLRTVLAEAATCPGVRITGLMLLPPWLENPEEVRPFFRRLRELRDQLTDEGIPRERLADLSMGMSHDFEVAIEEGATIVRVGTAIFGRRPPVVA